MNRAAFSYPLSWWFAPRRRRHPPESIRYPDIADQTQYPLRRLKEVVPSIGTNILNYAPLD